MSLFGQTVITMALLVPLTAIGLRLLSDSFTFHAQTQQRYRAQFKTHTDVVFRLKRLSSLQLSQLDQIRSMITKPQIIHPLVRSGAQISTTVSSIPL